MAIWSVKGVFASRKKPLSEETNVASLLARPAAS